MYVGCAGYADDPLPNIALWMSAYIVGRATMALQCTSTLRWFGQFFFLLSVSACLKKQQKLVMIMFEGHILLYYYQNKTVID